MIERSHEDDGTTVHIDVNHIAVFEGLDPSDPNDRTTVENIAQQMLFELIERIKAKKETKEK